VPLAPLSTDLRGKPFSIRKQDKEAYHAWGMFVLSVTNRAAGGERESGRIRWGSAERSKRADVAHPKTDAGELCGFGCAAIFQRPDCAGDVETVKKHLSALRAVPEAREVYLATGAGGAARSTDEESCDFGKNFLNGD